VAARVADLIRESLDVEVELDRGNRGIFEVTLDDEIVWTNRDHRGDLPESGAVDAMILKIASMQ